MLHITLMGIICGIIFKNNLIQNKSCLVNVYDENEGK